MAKNLESPVTRQTFLGCRVSATSSFIITFVLHFPIINISDVKHRFLTEMQLK